MRTFEGEVAADSVHVGRTPAQSAYMLVPIKGRVLRSARFSKGSHAAKLVLVKVR